MKKIISAILVLSKLLTMCIPAFAASKVLGDVNDDGKISAVDARIILQVVAGSKEKTELIKSNGDLNDDGKISAIDARVILQVVAGIVTAPETSSTSADETLKKYIMANGIDLEDEEGTYGLLETINGMDTFIYYYSKEDKIRFVCDIEMDGGDTIVFMNYKYGAETQEIMTSSTFDSSSKQIITAAYIYTSAYKYDGTIYLTDYKSTSADNAKAITSSATDILLLQIETLLSNTNTGVTLNSLGFTAW